MEADVTEADPNISDSAEIGEIKTLYSPNFSIQLMGNGDIVNVGGDGMTDPDYKLIQALEPDIVFVYSGEYGQQSQMSKLAELGINYAVDNEYLESDYLARMEWMRFLLTFFDADEEAEAAMANVQANIDEAKAKIEGLNKPVAAIFNIWDGTIFSTDDSSWVGSMTADMGAVNALADFRKAQSQ